jgi:hypothetical protein
MWNGNTVHWGAATSAANPQPRASFSVAFRRRAAKASHLVRYAFAYPQALRVSFAPTAHARVPVGAQQLMIGCALCSQRVRAITGSLGVIGVTWG